MEEQNKVLPKAAVVSTLDAVFDENVQDLEENLLPHLKHGEIKRLYVATLKYPKELEVFSVANRDSEYLIRAFAAARRAKDALVGLATEVVIERMIKSSQAPEETQISEADQRVIDETKALFEERVQETKND
jgi:protein-disulfide isomerase